MSFAASASASSFEGEGTYAEDKDVAKSIKQVAKYNKSYDDDQITNHIILFPFNFDDCHWTLCKIKMLIKENDIEATIKIYNSLLDLGGPTPSLYFVDLIRSHLQSNFVGKRI